MFLLTFVMFSSPRPCSLTLNHVSKDIDNVAPPLYGVFPYLGALFLLTLAMLFRTLAM
jgi:hypothetical protein